MLRPACTRRYILYTCSTYYIVHHTDDYSYCALPRIPAYRSNEALRARASRCASRTRREASRLASAVRSWCMKCIAYAYAASTAESNWPMLRVPPFTL